MNLRAGDRLEPSPGVPDVGMLGELPLPAEIVMWRSGSESLTKHRNPLFDEELGTLPQRCVVVGTLHCLYLGVMLVWCRVVLWMLVDAGIYGAMSTDEENIQTAVLVLRHNLMEFYKARHRERPGENLTRVSDLTPKMLGSRTEPKCKTKGAETWGMLLFLLGELQLHVGRLGDRGVRLLAAGQALEEMVGIWNRHGRVLPPDSRRAVRY